MRRFIPLLICLATTGHADVFKKGQRNAYKTPRWSSAALTGSDCDGAAQSFSDGTAITWTRATDATCTKNDGTLAILTSNQPRCNSTGCLIEGARTNIGLYSGDMENAGGYTNTTSGTGAGQAFPWSATANVVDPLGGTSKTASRFAWPIMTGGEGADNTSFIGNAYTISGLSGSYTLSVYARTLSGTQTFYLWGNTGAPSNSVTCVATTTWSRCTGTYTAPTAFRIGFDLNTPAAGTQQAGQAAGALYFWGAQLEAGAFPSSYISTTTTSATRNADIATAPMPGWFKGASGCALGTATIPAGVVIGSTKWASLLTADRSNATIDYLHIVDGAVAGVGGVGGTWYGGGYLNTSANVAISPSPIGSTTTILTKWDGAPASLTGGTFSATVNGSTVTSTSYPGLTIPTSNTFYLGVTLNNSSPSTLPPLNGYLSNLRIGSTANSCQ